MYELYYGTNELLMYGDVCTSSAARCWWTLKYFGHENVHVMNGK